MLNKKEIRKGLTELFGKTRFKDKLKNGISSYKWYLNKSNCYKMTKSKAKFPLRESSILYIKRKCIERILDHNTEIGMRVLDIKILKNMNYHIHQNFGISYSFRIHINELGI